MRDKTYLRYVSSFPCFVCGLEGSSQACHSNQGKHGKGKSIKASDEFTFPLCISHHAQHDACWEMSKAERDELEDSYIERMHRYAKRDGWLR